MALLPIPFIGPFLAGAVAVIVAAIGVAALFADGWETTMDLNPSQTPSVRPAVTVSYAQTLRNSGGLDTAIVLRTALIKDGTMYVQAGAGIVADSNPSSEQAECVNKAKALFRAAEEARRFASAAGRGQ